MEQTLCTKEVTEGRSGVRAAAFPTADNVIALGDEIRGTPEVEVRERRTEPHHEVPHVLATATRRMQGILKKHIRCSEFIDDSGVPGVAPKPVEPAAHNGFVFLFRRHLRPSWAVDEGVLGLLARRLYLAGQSR